ncbi:hypothetical protein B7Y94_02165 [Candidatus Saccharibacteria bacterium 32-49-12]|nr:MAG: hypothetical protein B7Y94_02165 [Candidatus Saccharibacteria bacterium 32-49-12]
MPVLCLTVRFIVGATILSFSLELVTTLVEGQLYGKIITSIGVGHQHACALADKQVYCWGKNSYGQLNQGTSGAGTEIYVPALVNVPGL